MERVECVGGPLDGAVIEIVDGAPEVQIRMADDTRHRYARRENGEPDRPVFSWVGRS